jgi:L-2-hydroxyglutarate oxidase LhgO
MVVLLRSCLVDSIHALVDAITVLAALGGESTPVQKDIEGDETISTFLRRGVFRRSANDAWITG